MYYNKLEAFGVDTECFVMSTLGKSRKRIRRENIISRNIQTLHSFDVFVSLLKVK